MTVADARRQYVLVAWTASAHAAMCPSYRGGEPCPATGKLWLRVDAASLMLDLAVSEASRARSVAGVAG